MSLEVFTGWIKDLIGTNPAGGDPKSQGDDHIRGIKQTLRAQFAGLTLGKAVTVNEDDLNAVTSTAARAAACLPKDGSESMTGALRSTSVTAKAPASASEVKAESPLSLTGLVMIAAPGFEAIQHVDTSGAPVVSVLLLGLDGFGNATELTIFSPTGVRCTAPLADASNDDHVATSAFVRKVSPRGSYSHNDGAVALNATIKQVVVGPDLVSNGAAIMVNGMLNVSNSTGALATVHIEVRFFDNGVASATRTIDVSLGGGVTDSFAIASAALGGAGHTVRAEVWASSTQAANVPALACFINCESY